MVNYSHDSYIRHPFVGIRLIKQQGSEASFKDGILKEHERFLGFLKPFFLMYAISNGFRVASTPIVAVISFAGYSLMGGRLTAAILFPAVALLDISSPIACINDAVQNITQGQMPLAKIEDFLLADESKPTELSSASSEAQVVLLKNVEAQYPTTGVSSRKEHKSASFFYVDELTLKKEAFYGICGPVGSGKSTLLKTLLGELTPTRGQVIVNGRLAYCAQEPWIMQGSIEDNIVFGSEFDVERLALAVESCGLQQDLLTLPDGIKSMIGENGVNLSGGQKSRIALARAVYSDADVYLLDNPLASCDAKVARRIFTRLRDVLKKKTVLMVSNSVSLLARMDQLIEFDEGRLKYFGPASGSEIDKLDLEEEDAESDSDPVTEVESDLIEQVKAVDDFVVKEDKEEGRVKKQLYLELIAKAGTWKGVLMFLCCIISFGFSVANPLWLKEWSLNTDESRNIEYLAVYVVFGLMDSVSTGKGHHLVHILTINVVFVVIACTIIIFQVGKAYHYDALDGLLKATVNFYDTNPIGRIMNRLNGDVIAAERSFSLIFGLALSTMSSVLAAVTIVCLSSPYMFILVLLLCLLTQWMTSFFSPGMVEGNRLIPVAMSNVYSLVNDILEGSSTINSFQQMHFFSNSLRPKLDVSFGTAFARGLMENWLCQRITLGTCTMTLAVSILSCLLPKTPHSAATTGLALLSVVSLSNSLAAFVFQFAIFESRVSTNEHFFRLKHSLYSLTQSNAFVIMERIYHMKR